MEGSAAVAAQGPASLAVEGSTMEGSAAREGRERTSASSRPWTRWLERGGSAAAASEEGARRGAWAAAVSSTAGVGPVQGGPPERIGTGEGDRTARQRRRSKGGERWTWGDGVDGVGPTC
jgi:hypothetical protein